VVLLLPLAGLLLPVTAQLREDVVETILGFLARGIFPTGQFQNIGAQVRVSLTPFEALHHDDTGLSGLVEQFRGGDVGDQ
jgi:hypothetical protein